MRGAVKNGRSGDHVQGVGSTRCARVTPQPALIGPSRYTIGLRGMIISLGRVKSITTERPATQIAGVHQH